MDYPPKFQHLPKFDYLFPESTPEADAVIDKVTAARQKFVREIVEHRRTLVEVAQKEGIFIEACAPEFSPVDANGVVTATVRYRIFNTRGKSAENERSE